MVSVDGVKMRVISASITSAKEQYCGTLYIGRDKVKISVYIKLAHTFGLVYCRV
jgi:hypothetical protein